MDLNVDNYSIDELKQILDLPSQYLDINILQKNLYAKMDQIKTIDEDSLPEDKDLLIEFYTKTFFKLLKNISILNQQYKKNSSLLEDTENAYGNIIGNKYTNSSNPNNVNNESIMINEKLLPPMPPNLTVQENNNFLFPHNNQPSINTFNSNLQAGVLNPLNRKSYKKIININTRFRNDYTTTPSTQFDFYLPSQIRKVVSMRVGDTIFPKMIYTVSPKLGSNFFFISTAITKEDLNNLSNWHMITIPAGSYNPQQMVITINNELSNLPSPLNQVTIAYNTINGTMSFSSSLLGGFFALRFDFEIYEKMNTDPSGCVFLKQVKQILPSNVYKDQFTLGWLLGFRGNFIKKIEANKVQRVNPGKKNNNNKLLPFPKNSTKFPNTCACDYYEDNINIAFIYSGKSSYYGEGLYDQFGTQYFLLAVDDFQNNHDINVIVSPFQFETQADNNIIAKISADCCVCCEHQPTRIYFGPTELSKLKITLYDDFGRIVDFNNADFSFTLELEILYDL